MSNCEEQSMEGRRMKTTFIFFLVLLTAQCSVGKQMIQENHGMAVFAVQCSRCHGECAVGQDTNYPDGNALDLGERLAPALNENGHVWMYSPEVVFQKISTGLIDEKSSMPKFEKNINERETILLIQYLYTLWTEDTKNGYVDRHKDSRILDGI
jgi:mono/diheme cytochrome c family protein